MPHTEVADQHCALVEISDNRGAETSVTVTFRSTREQQDILN